jgi:hypothetical protein
MSLSEFLLGFIAAMVLMLSIEVSSISKRLKERYPTKKEMESQWKDMPEK